MIVHAHRGASAYAPENTIPAFRLAAALGSGAVENDIHLTADGNIVVCHDDDISRTSNGRGFISQMTFSQLRQYDFGSWRGDEFRGTTIPSLEEFLAATSSIRLLNIELKSPLPAPQRLDELLEGLYGQLELAGRIESTLISTFHHDWAARLKQRYPRLRCALLYGERLNAEETLALVRQYRADAVHPNIDHLEQSEVEACLCRGIDVNVWTADTPEQMQKAASFGVTGIITNVPDRAAEFLAR